LNPDKVTKEIPAIKDCWDFLFYTNLESLLFKAQCKTKNNKLLKEAGFYAWVRPHK